MKKYIAAIIILSSLIALPAFAALKLGDQAPDFSAKASLAGKEFRFSLKSSLKKGPVVLYFFPAAFTSGCTVEAHEFAEAAVTFKEAGATLIGMSGDDIGTLHKFSTQECSSRFPVASDPNLKVIRAYDAALVRVGNFGLADRISYVIAPDGTVAYSYSALDPDKHVENTLTAVKALTKK